MGRKREVKKAGKPRRKLALRKDTLKDLTPGRGKDAKAGRIGESIGCSLACPSSPWVCR